MTELLRQNPDIYHRLDYSVTNECMESLVAGLDISPNDHVLAIGGSGDQVFAMLENASKVTVIDSSLGQINYIEARIKQLKDRDFEGFLEVKKSGEQNLYSLMDYSRGFIKSLERRTSYFSVPGRLEKIRAKIDQLDIRPGDISKAARAAQNREVNKLYLSNSIGHSHSAHKWQPGEVVGQEYLKTPALLEQIVERLQSGLLVYVTDHDELTRVYRYFGGKSHGDHVRFSEDILPSVLKLDKDLTRKAQKLDLCEWIPGVYRKI